MCPAMCPLLLLVPPPPPPVDSSTGPSATVALPLSRGRPGEEPRREGRRAAVSGAPLVLYIGAIQRGCGNLCAVHFVCRPRVWCYAGDHLGHNGAVLSAEVSETKSSPLKNVAVAWVPCVLLKLLDRFRVHHGNVRLVAAPCALFTRPATHKQNHCNL